MNEHFKRILDEGIAQITDAKKKADDAVVKAKRDMAAVAELAETLPQKMLEKMSELFVGEVDFPEGHFSRPDECWLQIGGKQEHFIRYDSVRKLKPMKGRYRVILVVQKVD